MYCKDLLFYGDVSPHAFILLTLDKLLFMRQSLGHKEKNFTVQPHINLNLALIRGYRQIKHFSQTFSEIFPIAQDYM